MGDLTVIMLTLNKLPQGWADYHRSVLDESRGDYPIITVSKNPLDWGTNLIQTEEGYSNIYKQMLRAARIATTKYIAIAEDDTLYPEEHFSQFRPKDDEFAYNMTRWAVFTWGKPVYFWKDRVANSTLIAPRELAVEALQERFDKWDGELPEGRVGELGRERIDRWLKVKIRKQVRFHTLNPVLCFNHDFSLDHLEKSHRKAPRPIQAFDIPQWGRAEEIVKRFA